MPSLDRARYCGAHTICAPHGSDRYVARRAGAAPTLLDEPTARLLMTCSEFRRLDEHAELGAALIDSPANRFAARVAALDPRGAPASVVKLVQQLQGDVGRIVKEGNVRPKISGSVRERLDALVRDGLLITEHECLALHDRAAGAATGAAYRIESVGIVTRDRPTSLRRCLDSLATSVERSGRCGRLILADDSDDAAVRDENRAIAEHAGTRMGWPVQYVGPAERDRLVEALAARAGVPAALAAFALCDAHGFAVRTGCNRNALLLASAGEVTLQVDDDVVWCVGPSPGQKPGVRCVPPGDPTEMQFHRDRAAALASVQPIDRDPLELHELFLGRTLGACADREAGDDRPIVGGPIEHEFMRHFIEGTGRVAATSFGIAGDSATGSPWQLLVARGASWADLVANFEVAAQTREIVRGASRATLVRGGFFMSTAVGLDHRSLLPPFVPVGRNQDGVFGVMLPLCLPSSYVAHLPWAIAHDPEQPRRFDPDAVWRDAGAVRIAELLIQATTAWRPTRRSGDARERMVWLGAHLEEVGSLGMVDFCDLLALGVTRWIDAYRRSLQENLRVAVALPAAVQEAATRQLSELDARVTSPDLLIPADLPGPGNPEQRLRQVQRLIADFGRLLQAWPAIRAAAEDLRDG